MRAKPVIPARTVRLRYVNLCRTDLTTVCAHCADLQDTHHQLVHIMLDIVPVLDTWLCGSCHLVRLQHVIR